jgi:hypothetical protein
VFLLATENFSYRRSSILTTSTNSRTVQLGVAISCKSNTWPPDRDPSCKHTEKFSRGQSTRSDTPGWGWEEWRQHQNLTETLP